MPFIQPLTTGISEYILKMHWKYMENKRLQKFAFITSEIFAVLFWVGFKSNQFKKQKTKKFDFG